MENKWHNSKLAARSGIAGIILALGFSSAYFMKSCMYSIGPGANEVEIQQIKHQYKLQTGDLNGNNIPEKFYVIDGKIAIAELDGKPIIEFYSKE